MRDSRSNDEEYRTMKDLTPITVVESIQPPADIPASVPGQDWTIVREWLRKYRNLHTRRSYARNIDTFYRKLARPLVEVTLTNLQDYADMIAYEYPEVSTQAQILASVKSLFTFAHETGYLSYNVGRAVQLPLPENKLAQRILDQTQLHKILIQAEKNTPRNHMLVLLLYASAVRCSEICKLRWRDCQTNRGSGQITVQGKRMKTRSIPIHPKVWQKLQNYKPLDAKPDDYVFPSRQIDQEGRKLTEARVWQIVSKIAEDAGIEDVSPHFLRHTHASRALETNKVSLKLIQETLGHEDLATTGRYLHAKPEDSSSMYLDDF